MKRKYEIRFTVEVDADVNHDEIYDTISSVLNFGSDEVVDDRVLEIGEDVEVIEL